MSENQNPTNASKFCQWDMSTFPSDGFLLEYDEKCCCGQPAPIRLEDEEFEIWSCAEHFDYFEQRPI